MKTLQDILNTREAQQEYQRIVLRDMRANRLTRWLRYIPILGDFVQAFWFCVLTEGVRITVTPRWGPLTFGYLNDGFKPTVWHTWRQMTRSNNDTFVGIYPAGAPRSLAEAQEWEAGWAAQRSKEDEDGLFEKLLHPSEPKRGAFELYLEHRDTDLHTGDQYYDGCPTCKV